MNGMEWNIWTGMKWEVEWNNIIVKVEVIHLYVQE